MRITKYVDLIPDIFGIINKSNIRVPEDKIVIIEDIGDKADDFTALNPEARVEFLVDAYKFDKFR